MSEPEMNCGWDFPEWELMYTEAWVEAKTTPQICKECEFFMICFQNLAAHALDMPDLTMSIENMIQFTKIKREMDTQLASEMWIPVELLLVMQQADISSKQ